MQNKAKQKWELLTGEREDRALMTHLNTWIEYSFIQKIFLEPLTTLDIVLESGMAVNTTEKFLASRKDRDRHRHEYIHTYI